MSDVFVSYKAEDRRRVKPLVEALESEGYSVWWDEQIGGGAAWRQSIETELGAAKCVIVAWSKRSVGAQGTFVQDEATRAQHRRVYVPVTIDKVQVPLGFGETQALALTNWRGDRSDPRYQAVLGAVQRLAGRLDGPGIPARPAGIDRRTALLGGGVAAVAVAGAGAWALLRPTSAEAAGSIAVLPFANLSGDPEQGYFSDGIAEELRSALGRLAGLKVVGRTSSEAVRDDDASSAAKKLGVGNILTGSVRQSESMIRVSAQLIDGKNGIERWSQNYDREPGDSIKIQTDIAENVARALSITLGVAGRKAISAGGTKNPEAQRLLFKAIESAQRGGPEEIISAIALSEAAIRADPRYADAYAHKSLYTNWYASSFARNSDELARMRADATELANQALRLAPDLPNGHRAIADLNRTQLNVGRAIGGFRRAIALEPGAAEPVMGLAMLLAAMGATEESIDLAKRAVALDPLNPGAYLIRITGLIAARRIDEGLAFALEVERTKPHVFAWPEVVAYILVLKGRYAEARQYLLKAEPDNYNRLVNEAVILARTGKSEQVAPIIARLQNLYGDAGSYQLAQIYAQLGDKDRAFVALNRGVQIRDAGLLRLKTDPYLDPLRTDPRYSALLRQLDFPQL